MAHVKTKNSGKHWTKEEVDFLFDNYTNTTTSILAEKLNRTETAVKRKIENLVGSRKRNIVEGYFTTSEVADILCVANETICRWIRNHRFPAIKVEKKLSKEKGNKNNHHTYIINPDKVWGWVKNNRDKFNIYSGQIKRGYILPEPKWLLEDIENNVWYGRSELWTNEMLATLYSYRFEEGLKLRECAEKFGKTLPAIQKQLTRINNMKLSELENVLLTKVAI